MKMLAFAGVRCEMDAWSEYTSAGPAGRQEHSLVWDAASQSALMFGGHASNAFLYFADIWRYHWPLRTWTEITAQNVGPGTRSGHAAIWDATSKSMLIFAGKHLGAFFNDIWRFQAEQGLWEELSIASPPAARAYHSAIWDAGGRSVLVFGGENSVVLNDLQRYSVETGSWSQAGGPSDPRPRSRHTAVWDAATRYMLVFGGSAKSGLRDPGRACNHHSLLSSQFSA